MEYHFIYEFLNGAIEVNGTATLEDQGAANYHYFRVSKIELTSNGRMLQISASGPQLEAEMYRQIMDRLDKDENVEAAWKDFRGVPAPRSMAREHTTYNAPLGAVA
jgi:hypothetical protein